MQDRIENLEKQIGSINPMLAEIKTLIARLVQDFEKMSNVKDRVIVVETRLEDLVKDFFVFKKSAAAEISELKEKSTLNSTKIAGFGMAAGAVAPILYMLVEKFSS